MTEARKIDNGKFVVGIDRELNAGPVPAVHDPGIPFDGMTFGVARMSENSPHDGERHADGDEILYIVAGRVRLVFTDDPMPDVELTAGETVIVPRGFWHRVDVLEPCHIVYMTPGTGNDVRLP